jgi:hypothetical protein
MGLQPDNLGMDQGGRTTRNKLTTRGIQRDNKEPSPPCTRQTGGIRYW